MATRSFATQAVMAALATGSRSIAVERTLYCSDGVHLALKQWPATAASGDSNRILCLHGWLDNSASFHLLGPALAARLPPETDVVALDFPGHGLSSHKSPDGPSQLLAEYAYYVAEAVGALGWTNSPITLLGHSMGANVSIVYAASFPEQVKSLVLLEGAVPMPRRSEDCSKHIRASVDRRLRSNRFLYPEFGSGEGGPTEGGSRGTAAAGKAKIYPTIHAAIEMRMKTAKLSPGEQYLSWEAAAAMVERATVPAGGGGGTSGGIIFRHDPRLQWPSLHYFTREQVESLCRDVQCPVCLLIAQDGWPFDKLLVDAVMELLQPSVHKILEGSHHFHADPDNADDVIEEVVAFVGLQSPGESTPKDFAP